MGFESGIDRKFSEAKIFYAAVHGVDRHAAQFSYCFSGGLRMTILLWSQVLNGFLLPVVMIFVLILVNRRDLMGEKVNPKGFNWVAWICHGGDDRSDAGRGVFLDSRAFDRTSVLPEPRGRLHFRDTYRITPLRRLQTAC